MHDARARDLFAQMRQWIAALFPEMSHVHAPREIFRGDQLGEKIGRPRFQIFDAQPRRFDLRDCAIQRAAGVCLPAGNCVARWIVLQIASVEMRDVRERFERACRVERAKNFFKCACIVRIEITRQMHRVSERVVAGKRAQRGDVRGVGYVRAVIVRVE